MELYDAASIVARQENLFVNTPLIERLNSTPGLDSVFLKLECLQPSGSFKDRGIGTMIHNAVSNSTTPITKLICSSGGNAGLAVATAGRRKGLAVEVYVPETTFPFMLAKLRNLGAEVVLSGKNWNEADLKARSVLSLDTGAVYIPPFDNPLIWHGHSTLVDELLSSLGAENKPDLIIASVGGGGLLCGLQQGLARVGWGDVSVMAVETEGAASFAAAEAAGHVVALTRVDTVATSLGAMSVIPQVLSSSSPAAANTFSFTVTDSAAVRACLWLVDEHRLLVEPACGTALAALDLVDEWKQRHPALRDVRKVVVVLCGGSAVNLDLMAKWKQQFNL